jgi:hypothetical protein
MSVPDSDTARQLHSINGSPAVPPDAARPADWLFEVKFDGFRALAHITAHHCELRSRNGHTFKHWPQLCDLRVLRTGVERREAGRTIRP